MTGPRGYFDDHGEWDGLAVGWALSALEPEDQARMAAHLPGCARCAETVRDAVHTVADLAYAVPDELPPRRLKRQIMEAAAAERRGAPAAGPVSPPREPPRTGTAGDPRPAEVVPLAPRRRRWVAWTAVAAGIALLAALGAWNVRLRSEQNDLQRIVAQRDELVQRLTAAGPAEITVVKSRGTDERTATVVVKDGRIGLITETLPRLEGAGTYWLWGLRRADDPDPVPLAGFNVPESKLSACNIDSPAGLDPRAFAISAESGPERPSSPGRVVGQGATDAG